MGNMPKIFSSLFLISLVAYFAFATVEEFVPGFVSDYFSPHFLLLPVIAFLLAMIILERSGPSHSLKTENHGNSKVKSWKGTGLIFAASIITLGMLWFLGGELAAAWRTLVSIYGALLVGGILTVLFKE